MKKLLAMGAAAAVLAASGCAPIQTEPTPKVTPQVIAVMNQKLPEEPAVTYEQAFARYQGCKAGTQVWEELEPGRVMFTCHRPTGPLIQFIWDVDNDMNIELEQAVFTSMFDADWSADSFPTSVAQEYLDQVFRGEPVFE